MQHPKKVYKYKSGFTLAELLCTCVLIQFLLFLSLPLMVLDNSVFVYNELRLLSSVIRYGQRKALIEGKPCKVTFDTERNSYTLDNEHCMHPLVLFGAQEGIKGPPSSPLHPLKEPFTWVDKKIVFYPLNDKRNLGRCSSGTVYLTDRSRSCTYALTCDASYGSIIRCYRYKGTWELLF